MKKINHAITKKYPHQHGSQQKLTDKIHRIPLPPLQPCTATGRRYLYDTAKTQKCSVVVSSGVINYLFTQNLFPRFPQHFIKFNVEAGLKITHWELREVFSLRSKNLSEFRYNLSELPNKVGINQVYLFYGKSLPNNFDTWVKAIFTET